MTKLTPDVFRTKMVEEFPDAVLGINDKHEIIDANPAALSFFNLSHEELLGKPVTNLIPEFLTHLRNQRFEVDVTRKNAGAFPAEVTSFSVSDGKEKCQYLIFRNITIRKKISNELQLFRDSIENSLNAFDIVDSNGNFIYVNKAYVKMWGYDDAGEIIGTSAVGHCADPDIPVKIISELKSKGQCNIEFEGLKKDGSVFNVLMWARLAYDSEGNEVYPTTSIDVTEKLVLQKELERSIKARDEFISICSHELKTPITSLKLQFQMTEKQLQSNDKEVLTPESIRKKVVHANKQLDRMNLLIEDMLDVSQIASGKIKLKSERLDLHDLASEVLDRLSDQLNLLKIPYTFKSDPGFAIIDGDRFRIEQVLVNLLTNAIKYGLGKEIIITITRGKKEAHLEVTDHGIGIAGENLDKIFNRYERAIEASEISGLGLGLYISQQIMELHHGSITVRSSLGKGSSFRLSLPLAD